MTTSSQRMTNVPPSTNTEAAGVLTSLPLPHVTSEIAQRLVALAVLVLAAWLGSHASLVTVFGAAAAIAAFALIRWQAFRLPSLLLVAAFVPFELGTGTASSINMVILGVVALSGLWLIELVALRRTAVWPRGVLLPWAALMAVALISILAGDAGWNPLVMVKPEFVWVQMAQWALYALSAAAFWLMAGMVRVRRELATMAWLLLALAAIWLGLRFFLDARGIGSVMLFDAAQFRLWSVALGSAFALYWPQLGTRRRLAAGALAVAMVAEPVIFAREWAAGWLPGLVVLGCFGLVEVWRRARALVTMTAITALPSAIWLLPRLYRSERWSLDTRVIAWEGIVNLLEGRWVMGLGLASYWHYWRGVFGVMQYRDPRSGYVHFTFNPKVNTHNNFVDVLGQMGLIGLATVAWLMAALAWLAWRVGCEESPGFGKAYAMASLAALAGMVVAGMLGDWLFPFVYNLGLRGFRDSFLAWLFLGGLVVLQRTHAETEVDHAA